MSEEAFIVRVSSLGNLCGWLSMADDHNHRVIVRREHAMLFSSRQAAHQAIAFMPIALESAGLVFSVEPARDS